MGSEWRTVPLENLCDPERGITYGIVKVGDFVLGGIPVIRGGDIRNGQIEFDDQKRVSEEVSNQFRRTILRGGEIVINLISEPGHCALVPNAFAGFNVSRDVAVIPPNGSVDHEFLCFYLRSRPCIEWLTGRLQGSVTQKINLSTLREVPVPLPSPTEQRGIAFTLGGIERKIALLRETNATLEAIAQAIFKSWFVDFDPVRAKAEGRDPEGVPPEVVDLFPSDFTESELGAIPNGWKSCLLDEACEVNPTRRLQKGAAAPYLEMSALPTSGHRPEAPVARAFSSGTKFMDGDSLLARITPCLENGKTAFVDFLGKEEVGWGSTEYIVLRPRAPLPPYWGYLLCRHEPFRQFAIQAMAGTSGRQRVDVSRLIHFRVALPSELIARAFAEIVEPIQMRIAANDDQVKTLASLRDTLLPRLMSGKLRISEVTV